MQRKNKLNYTLKIILVFMFFLGLGIFSYPLIVTQINEIVSQKMIENYKNENSKISIAQKEKLKEMKEKNKELYENRNMFTYNSIESKSSSKRNKISEYLKKHIVGAIYIPTIELAVPLYDKTDDVLLQYGATIWEEFSYPIGENNTHSVINGHSGLPDKKLFTDLHKIRVGECFFLDILGKKLAYKVESIRIILPSETEELDIQKDRELVTLVTCTPYMINTHRLLVTGYRVEYNEKKIEKSFHKIKKSHMRYMNIIIYLLTFLFILLILILKWIRRDYILPKNN